MPTFRYRYAALDPPAPSLLLNLAHPVTGTRVENISALADSGADQTVIPSRLVDELGLPKLDQEVVRGFDGAPQILGVYAIVMQVRDLAPIEITVIASPRITYAIIGRDVLNRYTVTLDGRKEMLTITDD
jgi:predicted aspartyl protease